MAAAKVAYTHNNVKAITSVPMMTASSIFPCGKNTGACKNKKTAPTAIFMPKVFMMKASSSDTSRISPVALRRNILPELPSTAEVALFMAVCLLCIRRADQVQHPLIPPVAFNGETETVGSIEYPGKFYKLACHVIGFSLHLQHRRSRGNTEQG